ncbi:hypothetical protein GDO81_029456, partial [Engystomops pustulosus]
GSVRSLRDEGYLYEERGARHSTPAWTGSVSVHSQEARQGEAAAQGGDHDGDSLAHPSGGTGTPLTTEMSSWLWSDVLQTKLHPKSLCLVSSPGGDGLESFSQGEAVFKAQLEELEDRLHFFSEECDYLQGFQLLCDLHNGFSGVGARTAELLHDEYPGRGILSFGTCPAPSGDRDPCTAVYQLVNCVLALGPLCSQSSFFCPLSVSSSLGRRPGASAAFPQLLYNAALPYHSSAVLALALNTLTAPYRMSSSGFSMLHFAEALTFGGRKMLAATCSVPFPLAPAWSLPDALLPHMTSAPWRSVSPCQHPSTVFSQSVVLRGIPETRQTSSLPAGTRLPSSLHACESGSQVLQHYLSSLYSRALSTTHLLGAPCALGSTFPQFFSRFVTKDGFTMEQPQSEAPVVGHIPVMGALQASSALHQTLRVLCQEVSASDVRRWMNFSTAAVEQDDFREAVDTVRSLAHCYREGEESDDSD